MGRECIEGNNVFINAGAPSKLDNIFDGGGTFMCWDFPFTDGEADTSRYCQKFPGYFILHNQTSTNTRPRLFKSHSTTGGDWTTTTHDIVLNAWNHMLVTYDDDATTNDPVFFVNGTIRTLSEITAPVGTATSDAGNDLILLNNSATPARDLDGIYFFYCFWTVILSDNEIGALSRGVNPFAVRNDSQVINAPLWGNQTPEPNYDDQTPALPVTGTSAKKESGPVELLENYL